MSMFLDKSQENSQFLQWQIDEVQVAIKEAEADEFATEIEVATVLNKWKTKLA